MKYKISKSEYMMFLRHPAFLWLKKYDKAKLPEIDENQQAIFDSGHAFEKYAEKFFPNPHLVGFEDFSEYQSLVPRTQHALKEDKEVIVQGGFDYNDLTCIVDVIQKVEENTYDLFEIKSSTKVKKDHIYDVAFQTHVLENLGLKIRNMKVMHVNRDYVRKGEIDHKKFVSTENITEEVRKLDAFTIDNITAARRMVERGKDNKPNFSPTEVGELGSVTDAIEVYRKLYEIPKYSIYDLAFRGSIRKLKTLEEIGCDSIFNIPPDFELTNKQHCQVQATKTSQQIIKKDKIKEFLDGIHYPIYFLDYETIGELVPPFDGAKPYQQIPFQYSLHILREPDGEFEHKGYLHDTTTDPSEDLAKQLIEDIGKVGTVLVWYEVFEKGRNNYLAERFPDLAPKLWSINKRIVDLMVPFSKDLFVDKDFLGKSSIKNVLPVLIKDLSYKDLEINNGGTAQRVWSDLFIKKKCKYTQDEALSALNEYCKLDTLAMVEIFKYLKQKVI